MASVQIGKRVVVIGAGMAGFTAAGARADHFDNIVVLERDILPRSPCIERERHRRGTPMRCCSVASAH